MTTHARGKRIGRGIAPRAFALCGALAAVACSDVPTPLEPAGEALPAVGAVDLGLYPSGAGTLELRFESGREEYLLAFQSTSASTAAFNLAVNTGASLTASKLMMPASRHLERTPGVPSLRDDAETQIRRRGREAVAAYGLLPRRSRSLHVDAPLQRSFWIYDSRLDADVQRPATLKHTGAHVLIYVDDAVPDALMSAADAAALGAQFDTRVYGPVRALYGSESDRDANGRVILFLTPLVNHLVAEDGCVPGLGRSGTVGYFSSVDMSASPVSNSGEVLYLLVPDPRGEFACATKDKQTELEQLVGVTAHELTHAIAFNERRFERNLPSQDDWLEEALAHSAEIALDMPVLAKGQIYHYLRNGSNETSLTGTDAGEEFVRGAATLFVTRLVDRFGPGVLRKLITGPGASVETVEGATGERFAGLFHDWSLALYNDLYPVPNVAPAFPSLPLREWVEARFGPMGQANRNAAEYHDPYGGGVYHALGPYGGEARDVRGYIPMKNASVTYLVVSSARGSTTASVRFAAPASERMQVAALRIK